MSPHSSWSIQGLPLNDAIDKMRGPVHTPIPGASPGPINDPEATLPPGRHDVCVVVGTARLGFYSAVSFLDFNPAPAGFSLLP